MLLFKTETVCHFDENTTSKLFIVIFTDVPLNSNNDSIKRDTELDHDNVETPLQGIL